MPKSTILLLLLLPFYCMAQENDASQKIISKFHDYSISHPGEKVYLHFDRPYYAAGDTIYYKAYLALAGSLKLSALSGVLHVELIDNLQGRALFSERLEIINGVAWGDFALPDTLTQSSYTIRAYTNLMRNDGESSLFQKKIIVVPVITKKTIINPTKLPTVTKTPTAIATRNNPSPKPTVTFFPEGGTLVTGISSKIAFKAIDPNGLGIPVKGIVTDDKGKQVCSFAATHLGMGAFYLTPERGKAYRANITYANGVKDVTALPAAADDGITIAAVNDSMLVIPVTIRETPGYFKMNKGGSFILTVFSGGELTNMPCRLDSPTVQAFLYKKKLHTGIVRLTLSSPDAEPLCERLLFINNNDGLRLNVRSEGAIYNKRKKVIVLLEAKDIKGQPVKGDFSVAVTDEGKAPVDSNNESTIVNYLLLSSELKGNIEQPNYYFNHASAQVQNDLDNLMLTQGYRRFEWKAVMANNDTVPQFPAEKALSLKGTVKNLQDKSIPAVEVALGALRPMIALNTMTDQNGNFAFNKLDITDTAKLLIRSGKGNKALKAVISPYDIPGIARITMPDTTEFTSTVSREIVGAMRKEYYQHGNMRKGIMLKQVNIHEDKNPEHWVPLLHSNNLNGAGRADQVIMGDDMEKMGCPQVSDCLAFMMYGAVRAPAGQFRLGQMLIINPLTGKPMAVLLDGVIRDQTALDEIEPTDIYSVEILKSSYYLTIYGSKAAGGLFVINTRLGYERANVNIQPGLTSYLFTGYYKAREFYSPVYDVRAPVNATPDHRTTLLWEPVLLTDKNGSASFSFYTADNPGKYRIIVEGMGVDGSIGHTVTECSVQ